MAKTLCQYHYIREYYRSNKGRYSDYVRKWRSENRSRVLEKTRAYRDAHRPMFRSMWASRRARERNATPPWLTEQQREEIRAIYREAERLSEETGVHHEVDHIVPLQGKTVCGLHVPWNLRAIPATENNRRPRIWREEHRGLFP